MPTPMPFRKWSAGTNLASPLGSLETLCTVARFGRGEAIYLNGEAADFWYRIVSGAARKCAFTLDGSRQIVDFLRPGDLFGYDAQQVQSFSVEAISRGTTVARYPRRDAERVADSDPHVARSIRELAFESVYRVQTRMLILGRATALEKVSSFLLEMVDRFRTRPVGPVTLPMSRYDIADYLAMAVETVSRALTNLCERGAIELESVRCVQIRDRDSLERVCASATNELRGRPPKYPRVQAAGPSRTGVAVAVAVGALRAT